MKGTNIAQIPDENRFEVLIRYMPAENRFYLCKASSLCLQLCVEAARREDRWASFLEADGGGKLDPMADLVCHARRNN
ncbi:MAG TPA: hypothetical protein VGB17_07490 [Pyrinomonadaceae bacterium]